MSIPILLMVRSLTPGGSERQLTEIARSLDRNRWQVHVGCFHEQGARGDELRAAGIPIVRFPVRSFRSPANLIQSSSMLGRYIREHGIRLIHTFDTPANLFGVLGGWVHRCPVILSSTRAYRQLSGRGFRWLLRLTDRVVDGVVVNCEALREHLIRDEHVPGERIRLCYNGIDGSMFLRSSDSAPAALAGASLVIGCICVLRPEKGLPVLLDAFAQVRELLPGMRLVLVGSGPMEQALRNQASQLRIEKQVWFEPATSDVPAWLSGIDIFVLPSRSEALSNSLMEAMLCRCAVVGSRVGGTPELIADGETGLLFESGNAESLAGCLRRLVEDPTLRKALAAAGERRIREHFTLPQSTARMEAIYLEFLERLN